MTGSGSGNVLAACEMPSSRKLKCRVEKVMTVVNFAPVVCDAMRVELRLRNAKCPRVFPCLSLSLSLFPHLCLHFNSISPAPTLAIELHYRITYTQRCSALQHSPDKQCELHMPALPRVYLLH